MPDSPHNADRTSADSGSGTASTRILGVCGSLRRGSLNGAALAAAAANLPPEATLTLSSLAGIPLYSADVQAEGFPTAVRTLAGELAAADAVLIASPEYNYSVPGVLKNAIDWVSRVPDQPFAGKPVAIMGASPGRLGTARAQYHLRQIFVFLDARVLNKPEVMIGGAGHLLNDAGELVDEVTVGHIRGLVDALVASVAAERRAAR